MEDGRRDMGTGREEVEDLGLGPGHAAHVFPNCHGLSSTINAGMIALNDEKGDHRVRTLYLGAFGL